MQQLARRQSGNTDGRPSGPSHDEHGDGDMVVNNDGDMDLGGSAFDDYEFNIGLESNGGRKVWASRSMSIFIISSFTRICTIS